jgi:hypothetical protein
MSELGDELHRLAEQGAEQARPLPAAEIVRRGDQRRRRRMVGGTVAGLAVAGAITGGVLSGVAGGGSPAPDRPAGRPVPASTGPATQPAAGDPAGGEHAGAGALSHRHLSGGRPEPHAVRPAARAHEEQLARFAGGGPCAQMMKLITHRAHVRIVGTTPREPTQLGERSADTSARCSARPGRTMHRAE